MSGRYLVSFEPIVDSTNVIGTWIIEDDCGYFMQPREQLGELYKEAGLAVIDMQDPRLDPIVTSVARTRGLVDESP